MMEKSLERIRARAAEYARSWNAKTPFHYIVIDDFLDPAEAEALLAAYPPPAVEGWDQTTYVHQRKKFTRTRDFPAPIADFFDLTGRPEFRALISEITGIPDLVEDADLVGGGLHQILRGGFLDVHVDYNFHPRTKLHRRLNLLVYMNKDWRDEYQGALELWDMQAHRQLENILPLFNRGVIFETNEVSFHGHPRPLNAPQSVTRKSLAVYYYTHTRDAAAVAPEHNTLYRQTTGLPGYVKTSLSATTSAVERARKQGLGALLGNVKNKVSRRLQGRPPENI
jgi:Rps23 Pro-64 3,4-dihydroxylase Tpa1-like proline 4-hydroxylase